MEELYLGLRTTSGVVSEMLPADARNGWVANGWAVEVNGRHRLTPEGWLRLDALVRSVA
jgi:hypothetical protein